MDTVFIYVYDNDLGSDSWDTQIRKVYFSAVDALEFFNLKEKKYEYHTLQVWERGTDESTKDFSPNERDKNNFIKTFGL